MNGIWQILYENILACNERISRKDKKFNNVIRTYLSPRKVDILFKLY